MVKFYTAFTKEIDDPETAVAEILEQLKPGERQLANTVGLVQFFHEFVDTGVYGAVAAALPFELVGGATLFNGTNAGHGDFAMSVTMLTSDDVTFAVKTVRGVTGKTRERISEDIVRMGEEFCDIGEPKAVLAYLAFMQHYSGDDLMLAVNSLPKPFPLFGTMVFADDQNKERNMTVSGAEASHDMCAFVALYGNVDPVFRITTSFAYEENTIKASEVTDAEGPVLKAVDGVAAVEFLKQQGLINSAGAVVDSGVWAVPAVITYPDGIKVVRAFMGMDAESGCVFAGGHVMPGAKISFTTLSGEKTLASATGLLSEIFSAKGNDTLAISCAARLWALGARFGDEAEKIAEIAAEYEKTSGVALSYSLGYSGGELCPVKNENGEYVNAFHNYTLIACTFN